MSNLHFYPAPPPPPLPIITIGEVIGASSMTYEDDFKWENDVTWLYFKWSLIPRKHYKKRKWKVWSEPPEFENYDNGYVKENRNPIMQYNTPLTKVHKFKYLGTRNSIHQMGYYIKPVAILSSFYEKTWGSMIADANRHDKRWSWLVLN